MFKFFKNLFKEKPVYTNLVKPSTKQKLESYCYGIKVGERLKKHLKEENLKETFNILLIENCNVSFYLGFKKGIGYSSTTIGYKVEEIKTKKLAPFSFNIKPEDFAKTESNKTQIYLRHS